METGQQTPGQWKLRPSSYAQAFSALCDQAPISSTTTPMFRGSHQRAWRPMVFRCVSSYVLNQNGHTSSTTCDTTTPKAQTARAVQALRLAFFGGFVLPFRAEQRPNRPAASNSDDTTPEGPSSEVVRASASPPKPPTRFKLIRELRRTARSPVSGRCGALPAT